jgi:hypothetical protein
MHDVLPTPVARYLSRALADSSASINTAQIVQHGQFRLGSSDRSWRSFRATQRVGTAPPGFVWDARIRIAPCVRIHVRDAYGMGAGSMRATLAGLIPIVSQRDSPELNAGALQRYLAEAVWIPTALRPGHGVRWTPIDDNAAVATLSDGGITVSLQFGFNEAGEIVSAFSPNRYREVKGRYEPTPWTVRLWDYRVYDGMSIPCSGEVAWELNGVQVPYWRGRIAGIEFSFDDNWSESCKRGRTLHRPEHGWRAPSGLPPAPI